MSPGQTFYGPDQTIDTADYAGIDLEGKKAIFLDTDINDPTKLRSGRVTRARLQRNVSGSTLYAGYAVVPSAGLEGERFDAVYTRATPATGIIDDRLGSGGVRNGDLCWILFEGPAYYRTPSADPLTAVGDLLFIKNADGGRLTPWGEILTFSAADVIDGDLGNILANSLGRAMEASTNLETDAAKLIDLGAATFG